MRSLHRIDRAYLSREQVNLYSIVVKIRFYLSARIYWRASDKLKFAAFDKTKLPVHPNACIFLTYLTSVRDKKRRRQVS
jgi:hypothetical protein